MSDIVQCTIHGNVFDYEQAECAACAGEKDAEIERLREQNGLLLGEMARRSEAHAKRIEELNLVIHEKAERLDDLVGDGVKPCDRDLVQRLRSLTGTRADGIAAAKRIEELERLNETLVLDRGVFRIGGDDG